MKLVFILFLSSLFLSNSVEETKDVNKRLTFKETFDPENTYYILNAEEEYKEIKNLKKNEEYKNSSSYSYEWTNHPKQLVIVLADYLPEGDAQGYRDMTKYDTVYFNIYSKKILPTKVTLVIPCQERTPDEISDMPYAYRSIKIPINFEGWKEIKISFKQMDNAYGGDLSKVKGFSIYSNGWGNIPNNETELYIDKICFTKLKYEFNMKESEITEDNYIKALDRFKYIIMGNGNILTEKNPNMLLMLKYFVRDAKYTQNLINKKGVPFDYPMESSLDIYSNYYKMVYLAKGYAVEGSETYKNKTLFDDIIYCLDYMHDNYYTKRYPKHIKGSDSFWHWEIGIPQELVLILTLLKDELSQEQIDKYLTPLNDYIFYPKLTMSNKMEIGYSSIIAGILQKDYTRVAVSVEMLREMYHNVEIFDGFYDDWSFIQHEIYGYVGAYGVSFINSLSRVSYILDETCFRLDDFMIEKQYNWLINSYFPFMYNGAFFDLVRGRDVTDNTLGIATANNVIQAMVLSSKYLKKLDEIQVLKSYLKYLYELNKDYYDKKLSIISLALLEEIINDESIQPKNIINNFAKVYSRIDKAISQIDGVGMCISLSSTRTGKYESMSGENTIGWYEGDGMTYIYLSNNDYANSYWPYVNTYRLPGTTVTNAPREKKGISDKSAYAKYDFVGGTYSDINMVAVMKFASESPGIGFYSSLIGNKAYFVFGNNLISIGNNISCNDSYDVETIIENRKLNGTFYFGDNEVIEISGNVNDNYIYIENYGGIYIPDYSNVKYEITDNRFLEIYFAHGQNIKNANYKYYIFPNVDKNNFQNLVNNIEILSDTQNVTAVKNKLNNVKEYVFWEKGKFDNIEVDNPCTIILYENEFYISDPSQKLEYINVNIGNENFKVNLRKGYTYNEKLSNSSNGHKILDISILIFILILLI